MRIAVVGSRELSVKAEDIAKYVSEGDEIVSGGAKGVDRCAAAYAEKHGLRLAEFRPQYARYGRAAPIVRNQEMVDYADKVVVFWNGRSKGALSVIRYAEKREKSCTVILCDKS